MQADRLDPRPSSVESEVIALVAALAAWKGGEGPGGTIEGIDSGSSLTGLGFDSLACADLAVSVEERFGVRLADADVVGLRTVEDVVRAVDRSPGPRPRVPPGIGRIQPFGRWLVGPAFRLYTRLRVTGRENVPPEGPVILAGNHRSMLDIPLLAVASPRPIVFMAKREIFRFPPLALLFHELGGFPVDRRIADLRAVDVGLAVLERAQVLGLYPEGTRNLRTGTAMLPFLQGTAWLALKAGVPIVPCGVSGTGRPVSEGDRRRRLRRNVRIRFGPPIRVPAEAGPKDRRERAAEVTALLEAAVRSLL